MKRTAMMICMVLAATIVAAGCKKDEAAAKEKAAEIAKALGDKMKAPAKKEAADKPVQMKLPKTGFTVTVPAGTKVEEAIIDGADSIKLPGAMAAMIVKPGAEKTLDALEKWAKEHQIQKFQSEVLKEGKDKTYTFIYNVDQMGENKAIYHQTFEADGKSFTCFSNADSADLAKKMKAACDSLKAS